MRRRGFLCVWVAFLYPFVPRSSLTPSSPKALCSCVLWPCPESEVERAVLKCVPQQLCAHLSLPASLHPPCCRAAAWLRAGARPSSLCSSSAWGCSIELR